ncbi:peptidase associated/transthyretin-like domain-containing protein [Gelidibacter gilvus]|uniref:Carboxypeptidase regulatory-like domain-containing protein n=1 Tax=Gelidibacter gilvus TaxID=59602 RepID=A0A4Q0XCN3_9FLAO|nr:hypothetical protein [Gelidibacter gilvus]RXJ45682.1 hypothetical protein ESZ48_14890 [Gelidibacter gilvus]
MTLKRITQRRRLLLCFFPVAIATSYPPLIANSTTALAFFTNKSIQQNGAYRTITDEHGLPVAGATVIMKSTNRGAVTALDGNYMCCKAIENTLYGKRNINHVLEHDTQKVYGMVINTGYYNTTDREKTGILRLIPPSEQLDLVFGKGLLFTGFLLTTQWPLFPIKICCL